MAESKISRRGIIRLEQSKTVTIGTSNTFVSFNFSIPDDYTIVCPVIYHSYACMVQGGIEAVTRNKIYGYYKKPDAADNIAFTINAIAIPDELLRSISIS